MACVACCCDAQCLQCMVKLVAAGVASYHGLGARLDWLFSSLCPERGEDPRTAQGARGCWKVDESAIAHCAVLVSTPSSPFRLA